MSRLKSDGVLRDSQLRQPISNGSQLRMEPRMGAGTKRHSKICTPYEKICQCPLATQYYNLLYLTSSSPLSCVNIPVTANASDTNAPGFIAHPLCPPHLRRDVEDLAESLILPGCHHRKPASFLTPPPPHSAVSKVSHFLRDLLLLLAARKPNVLNLYAFITVKRPRILAS
jgi:hypothetical protein